MLLTWKLRNDVMGNSFFVMQMPLNHDGRLVWMLRQIIKNNEIVWSLEGTDKTWRRLDRAKRAVEEMHEEILQQHQTQEKVESDESKEFIKRTDEDGEPVTCHCCDYWAPTRPYNGRIEGLDRTFMFCEVCYCTWLSSSIIFPTQCPDTRLHRSVAWIANRVLDEIRLSNDKTLKKKFPPKPPPK